MKVLFLHERFGAWAGAEANLHCTAVALKERGHTVGIVHGTGTGRSEDTWHGTFAGRYPLGEKHNAETVIAALEDFQPDVLYVHKLADLDVLEAAASCGLPVVRMVHDHDLYCLRSYRYNYLTRGICTRAFSPFCIFPCGAVVARNSEGGFPVRWVSYFDKKRELAINQRFHRFIVATDYMREELLRNGFPATKIEIHAPVPPNTEPAAPSASRGFKRLIYTGQIIRGKGVDVLLESLAQVRTPFQCFIFGDGNHRAYCEELSRKLGLNDRVHFEGYVSREQLQLHYRASDVMVVSSVWPEPFGAVGLEAMRWGLPVVAFDAGGIRQWLRDGQNGFLIPWMDRAAFAARVDQLLQDDSLAHRMGERGRQLAAEEYDFPDYIAGLETLFERVVTENTCEMAA